MRRLPRWHRRRPRPRRTRGRRGRSGAGEQPRSRRSARGNSPASNEDIQGLKKDVVDLNKDLFILEEELLFPANTQVAVFLSVDVGDFFALDSVQLKIDQKEVINYLYTPREVEALLKVACSACTSVTSRSARMSWWRSSTARDPTIAPTSAARRCASRRVWARNTSS